MPTLFSAENISELDAVYSVTAYHFSFSSLYEPRFGFYFIS